MNGLQKLTGWAVAAVIICTLGLSSGCETDAQTGALLGSVIGAAAGAGIDHNNRGEGALIGAGVGAAGGYMIGNESDKKKQRDRYNHDY